VTVSFLQRVSIASATRVVDVGCGAGQTLRIVEELNPSVPLVGVDADGTALEHGHSVNGRIVFVKGQGERLPIADGCASHVVSRVAINYMHQASALGEMARILEPGGRMLLSVHGLGYTLRHAMFPQEPGWRQRLGNLKDLLVGLGLQISGFQAKRTTLLGRSVPYCSLRRLRRQLRRFSCGLTHVQVDGHFLGAPTVWWILVEKTVSR
jgi:SAM-dependent methyltransferase